MELEDYERKLAVDAVRITSSLPFLENPHEEFCLPGTHERAKDWQPKDFHQLSVPYFREGEKRGTIRLPFRESGCYPEVEENFAELQRRYECLVREAYQWEPLKESGECNTSSETKKAIAATLVSRQLLALAGSGSGK